MYVPTPKAINNYSGMTWTPYDWLNYKFYGLYMAYVVSVISRCGLGIDGCHKNQPSKSKLALYS